MNLQNMSKLDRELLRYVLESELDLALEEYRELEEDSVFESILMESSTEKEEKKSKLKEKINKIVKVLKGIWFGFQIAAAVVCAPVIIAMSLTVDKSANKKNEIIDDKKNIFFIDKDRYESIKQELKFLKEYEGKMKKIYNTMKNTQLTNQFIKDLELMKNKRNFNNQESKTVEYMEISKSELKKILNDYYDVYYSDEAGIRSPIDNLLEKFEDDFFRKHPELDAFNDFEENYNKIYTTEIKEYIKNVELAGVKLDEFFRGNLKLLENSVFDANKKKLFSGKTYNVIKIEKVKNAKQNKK